MKRYILYVVISLAFAACKNDPKNETPVNVSTDTIVDNIPEKVDGLISDPDVDKQQSIIIKQRELQERKDESDELEELIIAKSYIRETEYYTIDFQFPQLNENINPAYANFNEYINDSYANLAGIESELMAVGELICDSIPIGNKRESRKIDYKVFNVNEKLASFVFYKENFYSQTLHPTYSFDCMNYDLERSVFMKFEDFFTTGSEEVVRGILNEVVIKKVNSGEMYYDCWEISGDDFFKYKDNFVVDDATVEYYFDDCVICPSYTGSYSVKVPLEELLPVLRRESTNLLNF